MTKHGIKHLFDIYAGDLKIYMNRHQFGDKKNYERVIYTKGIMELFFVWSGLKVNKGKISINFWS